MTGDPVGFIGAGKMGGAMIERLLDAGISLIVCDPNPAATAPLRERGARIATTPREVADNARIVCTSVAPREVNREVALGPDGIAKGSMIKIYIEMSTIGTAGIDEIADELRPAGIAFLDAPVSGGPPGARAGKLAAMVSGPRDAYEQAKPVIDTIAGHVFYVGEKPGWAQLTKIINNHLSKAGKVAAFEGLVMARKAGLDAKTLIDVINVSSGQNATTTKKIPATILKRSFKYNGPLHNLLNSAELFLEEAGRLGVTSGIGENIYALLQEAAENGYMEEDSMRMIEHMERKAGIDVPPPTPPVSSQKS